ncbi:MAG: tRNA (N6-isopentenyl adenosine(37)-C2)-methylthiotransferase MiaB [Candidatus Zixiibacteriota bacterium]
MDRKISSFHVTTFGCQMNLADSSTLVATLTTRGYRRVEDVADADLIILNTCSVREKAEQRVVGRLGTLGALKKDRPWVRIAVVGCMAQRLGDELIDQLPQVDYVLGTDRVFELPDVIEGREGTSPVMTAFGHESIDQIEPVRENTYSGFVTISRGCDNFCSYCIVPFVRGHEQAHSPEHILQGVRKMANEGVSEVMLLGQNVNSYRYNGTDFPDLLRRVASETDIPRIRFMTSHPKDLSEKLVEVLGDETKLMPHVHLPLQSGSDRILQRMGRYYSLDHYLKIVDSLRSALDYLALTTDLIVGFPGESEAEYEMTLDAVRRIQYDSAFMFRYSVRPGTEAAKLVDDVPEETKIERLNKLIALQQSISYDRNQREVGQVRQVLLEGRSRRSDKFARARTEGNKTVLFEASDPKVGAIVPLRITSADAFTLHGEPVEEGSHG